MKQRVLYRLSPEDKKDVRELMTKFAKHVEKKLDLEPKTVSKLVCKFNNSNSKPVKMTEYRLFIQENRDKIREATNGVFSEYNKMRTEMWNEVKSDKSQYDELRSRAESFNKENNLIKEKKRLSGYMLFHKTNRVKICEEFPNLSVGDVSKKSGEDWRALSQEERQSWKDKAKCESSTSESESSPTSTDDVATPVKNAKKSTKKSSKKSTKKSSKA